MGRGLDNYFLILELDFNKPESNEAFIEQRIKEKLQYWNKNGEKGKCSRNTVNINPWRWILVR